jgi:hypothetical protein
LIDDAKRGAITTPAPHATPAQHAPPTVPNRRNGARVRTLLVKTHRWVALATLVWLFLVGVTGFFLGRLEWRWLHQTVIAGLHTPVDLIGKQHIRHPRDWVNRFAIDPENDRRVLSGGVGGLWISTDATTSWTAVDFAGESGAPQIFEIAVDPTLGWRRVLLATDDGIWRLSATGSAAERFALSGQRITSLQLHGTSQTIIGVIDKTTLFKMPTADPRSARLTNLSDTAVVDAPQTTTLAKYGFDLHATAGLPSIPLSKFVNDLSGLALPALCLTGLLYWYLPRRRRKPGRGGVPVKVMQWLFRVHVFVTGLLVCVPLLYLSSTGIAMGHKFGFNAWAKHIHLDASSLTGNYDLKTLSGEVNTVFAPTENPDRLYALTRLGAIRSLDGGQNWTYDHSFPLKLSNYWATAKYRLVNGYEFISDEGNRHFFRAAGEQFWTKIPTKTFGLILDARRAGDSIYLYTWYGIHKGTPEAGFEQVPLTPAPLHGLDLAFLIRVVHGLLIYHDVLVWFNDASAVAVLILALTGLIIWLTRKRKWV